MHDSIIIAAPLLIAGMVAALRFVGCQFDPGTAESYSATVLGTVGLVSFWRLNEASGPTATDSEDGNPGTYEGGVTLGQPGLANTDTNNTAAKFDGTSGYVSVPHAAALNPPAFTVEAIVNPSAIGNGDGNDYHAIISSRNLAGSAKNTFGYVLYLHGTNFEAWLGTGTPSFSPPLVVTANAAADGGPYYVAMTYDGTTLTLYVNPTGDQTDTDQVNSTTVVYRPMNPNPLRIGAGANEQAPVYFFPGVIQDVAVYDAALDAAVVLVHSGTALMG